MTELSITPGLLLTLMVSAAVAVAVYLDTKKGQQHGPSRGDLYMAITAAAAVAAVLMGLGLASVPPPAAQTSVVAPAPSCPSPSGSC